MQPRQLQLSRMRELMSLLLKALALLPHPLQQRRQQYPQQQQEKQQQQQEKQQQQE